MSGDKVVVIGAGPAGIEASLNAADLGAETVTIERDEVGGTPVTERYTKLAPTMEEADDAFGPKIDRFMEHENIELRGETEVVDCEESGDGYLLTLDGPDGEEEIEAGSVIMATGIDHFDPTNETQFYGYHELDDVITLLDAEKMLKDEEFVKPSNGEDPETVAFIQCVGSRDRQIGNPWCSKVCCGVASKQAIEVKEQNPDTDVIVFYIDMRTYGFLEDDIYWEAQEEHQVRYVKGVATEITKKGDKVLMKGDDSTMGRPYEVEADIVVLSVGMEPSEGTKEMAEVLDVPLEDHGFVETTGALEAVQTPKEGIYAAGGATGPVDLNDSVSQAGSAASKAVANLNRTE